MKKLIMLLLTILCANNSMNEPEENYHSLTVILPNHQSVAVQSDYHATLKELKEAIRKKYEADDMPLPVDRQILYPIPYSNKPLSQIMCDDNATIGTLMLTHHTNRFKLAMCPASSEKETLVGHEQWSFLAFLRNLLCG